LEIIKNLEKQINEEIKYYDSFEDGHYITCFSTKKGEIIQLIINNPEIDYFPLDILDLKSLEVLVLYVSLKEIPQDIFKKRKLKGLHFGHLNLEILNIEINKNTTLECFSINHSKLEKIPKSLENLRALKFLNLSNNKIDNLPDSLGNLKNLEHLHLQGNPLKKIPESITKLHSLKVLYITIEKLDSNSRDYVQKLLDMGVRVTKFKSRS